MKNIFFLLFFVNVYFFSFAQTDSNRVEVIYEFKGKDTLRSFSVLGEDPDRLAARLTENYGAPEKLKKGSLLWTNITLDGIGFNLKLKMSEGILVNSGNISRTLYFKSEADKKRKISQYPDGLRTAYIEILLYDYNLINDQEKEHIVKGFLLQEIIKE